MRLMAQAWYRVTATNPRCVERGGAAGERDQVFASEDTQNTGCPGMSAAAGRAAPFAPEDSVLGQHLAEVCSQLQGVAFVQGPCAALAVGLLQECQEALPVPVESRRQGVLPLLQLRRGGVQASEVVHGDLQG